MKKIVLVISCVIVLISCKNSKTDNNLNEINKTIDTSKNEIIFKPNRVIPDKKQVEIKNPINIKNPII